MMDIIQFKSLYIPVLLYTGFLGFFLHHVEHKIFPLQTSALPFPRTDTIFLQA